MSDPTGTDLLAGQLGRKRFMSAVAGRLCAAPLAVEAQLLAEIARLGTLSSNLASSIPRLRRLAVKDRATLPHHSSPEIR
jgi:hypothetical protein